MDILYFHSLLVITCTYIIVKAYVTYIVGKLYPNKEENEK